MAYSSVPQLAEVLAHGIAAALPGHPHVPNATSFAPIKLIGPRKQVRLGPLGFQVQLGPGHGPQLVLFFNTWDPDIAVNLRRLNAYESLNSVAPLVAIDEGNVEPSANSLASFFRQHPGFSTPVVVDPDGRIADGYGVQDSPWLTLVSGSGKILWSYDVATHGWPSMRFLVSRVHAALAHARG